MKCDFKDGSSVKLVRSNSKDGPQADLNWVRWACGKLFCDYCRTVDRSLYPRPLDVGFGAEPLRTWTIGSLFRVGIPIFRADLAEMICKAVPHFVTGRCLLPNGQVVSDYVTMYSDKWVLMRGDKQTRTEVCRFCGSIWTDLVMVFRGRPAYLLRHQLSKDPVQQDCDGSLFMTDEFAAEIDWSRFRDIRLQRVAIRDTPLDGRRLPGDPDWDAMGRKAKSKRESR